MPVGAEVGVAAICTRPCTVLMPRFAFDWLEYISLTPMILPLVAMITKYQEPSEASRRK